MNNTVLSILLVIATVIGLICLAAIFALAFPECCGSFSDKIENIQCYFL